MGKLELFAYFIRDIILLIASSIVVSSTIFASFLEVYLSHLVAGVSKVKRKRTTIDFLLVFPSRVKL